MVNLQKERSQTHQKAHFRTKKTLNSVKKKSKLKTLESGFLKSNFFLNDPIKAKFPLWSPSLCIWSKQIHEQEARIGEIWAKSSKYSVWEGARPLHRCARPPGWCATIPRAFPFVKITKARPFQGCATTPRWCATTRPPAQKTHPNFQFLQICSSFSRYASS